VFGFEHERCRTALQLRALRGLLAFFRAAPVGRGLSPEFLLRMVAMHSPDDKRYFFTLR